jgi:ergothioneine biosynthesis protein EgtB
MLLARYREVRRMTEVLAAPLSAEDQTVQSMPDASPTKWHRAHTTWFFETVVLAAHDGANAPHDSRYAYLFNSYYDSLGARHPRAQRGVLTRPTCAEVADYRAAIDGRIVAFINGASTATWQKASSLIMLGLHHEQQHQELLLTDILHAFSCNPLLPAYRPAAAAPSAGSSPIRWIPFGEGIYDIGHADDGFAFDNEGPRHRVALRPYALASRPVTNGEWLSFMKDGGYRDPHHWLSDGWATAQEQKWSAPLHSRAEGGAWKRYSFGGLSPIDPHAPVTNLSFYEADAYARWAGKRLPTEAEWEVAARTVPIEGNFLEAGVLEPRGATGEGLTQMFGDVWEWTQSAYAPYPGFRPYEGAVSEYNGKFMVNQLVLRGGSCLTPASHMRATYRNFFHPQTRWQIAGLRLADDV